MHLPQKTKDLMLNIIDDDPVIVPIMHQLTRYKDCYKILKWLYQNNMRGKNLKDWIKVSFNDSVISMVQYIVMRNNQETKEKPIIYGKDWA